MRYPRSEIRITFGRALFSAIALHILFLVLFLGFTLEWFGKLSWAQFLSTFSRRNPPTEIQRINVAFYTQQPHPTLRIAARPTSKKAGMRVEPTPQTTPSPREALQQSQPDSAQQTLGINASHLAKIRSQIESVLVYPLFLQRRQITGETTLQLALSQSGELQEVRILKSSGHPALDEIALKAAKDAAPFPVTPIEDGTTGSGTLKITLPIVFTTSNTMSH